MDLLRREWGYMLYTDLSVQSTLLEGFTANGSLSQVALPTPAYALLLLTSDVLNRYRSYRGYNYDPSYTSHAHGWSSGPTSALTYYVLGLTVTSPQGQTWQVAPHLSGLSAAEGGFTTPLGWFGVKWEKTRKAFMLEIDVPKGTVGEVKMPVEGRVSVDGRVTRGVKGQAMRLVGGKHIVFAAM